MSRRQSLRILRRLEERGSALITVRGDDPPYMIHVDLLHWDDAQDDEPVLSLDDVELILKGRLVR